MNRSFRTTKIFPTFSNLFQILCRAKFTKTRTLPKSRNRFKTIFTFAENRKKVDSIIAMSYMFSIKFDFLKVRLINFS